MSDVDSQVAVRIDLRDGVFRGWTGTGSLMLDEVATVEEGTLTEIGEFGSSIARARALEAFGSTLYLGTWDGAARLWSVDVGTGAATAASGSTAEGAFNSLFEIGATRYAIETDAVTPLSSTGARSAQQSFTPGLPSRARVEASAVTGGFLYFFVLERATDTRGFYRATLSAGSWSQTRVADLGAPNIRGATIHGGRLLGTYRMSDETRIVEVTPATGALRDVWTVPTTESFTGLASLGGTLYAATQTALYSLLLPGTSTSGHAYLDGDASGLLEATLPNISEEGGVANATISIASNDRRWRASQGPVAIELREVVRLPGGEWTPSPLPFRFVLGETTYQNGVWRASAVPVAASARHRANIPEWSSLNQLARTDGADTALSKLRSTGKALPFATRFNR